jgi:hypothetical protein
MKMPFVEIMTELKEISVRHAEAAQNWTLALAFRQYQSGDGFMAWAAGRLLGKHGVMHCDILMTCMCNEVRCGCDRSVDDTRCTSTIPGRRCTPCRYRAYEQRPKNMPDVMWRRQSNAAHKGHGHVHIVTFTALETGVICRIERDFNYHYFYRVHATPQQAKMAEDFMIAQIGAQYNLVGSRCNFNPLLPCFYYCCPCGVTWDDFDPERDPDTGRIINYTEKITHWRWFCSEFATATLCYIGMEGFTSDTRSGVGCAEPCTISPDDLMGLVLRQIKTQKQVVYSIIDPKDVVPNTTRAKKVS